MVEMPLNKETKPQTIFKLTQLGGKEGSMVLNFIKKILIRALPRISWLTAL